MVAAVFIRKRGTRGNELVIQDKKKASYTKNPTYKGYTQMNVNDSFSGKTLKWN